MSKALAVKDVVSARVSIATLDGLSSVVLDQAAVTDTVAVTTSAATRGILVQSGPDSVHVRSGEIALVAATEVSSVAPLSSISSTDGASSLVIDQAAGTDTVAVTTNAATRGILVQSGPDSVHVRSGEISLVAATEVSSVAPLSSISSTDGASSLVIDQAAGTDTVVLGSNASAKGVLVQAGATDSVHVRGGDVVATASAGNFVATASQVVLSGSSVLQTVLTLDNAATLLAAAASYPVLDSGVIPAITVCSRINIAPGVGGTLIQSIYAGAPSGRAIEFQNIGTGVLVFVNQSVLGTGVLIRGPGDYTVPPGGGVITMFDGGQNFWFVRGI